MGEAFPKATRAPGRGIIRPSPTRVTKTVVRRGGGTSGPREFVALFITEGGRTRRVEVPRSQFEAKRKAGFSISPEQAEFVAKEIERKAVEAAKQFRTPTPQQKRAINLLRRQGKRTRIDEKGNLVVFERDGRKTVVLKGTRDQALTVPKTAKVKSASARLFLSERQRQLKKAREEGTKLAKDIIETLRQKELKELISKKQAKKVIAKTKGFTRTLIKNVGDLFIKSKKTLPVLADGTKDIIKDLSKPGVRSFKTIRAKAYIGLLKNALFVDSLIRKKKGKFNLQEYRKIQNKLDSLNKSVDIESKNLKERDKERFKTENARLARDFALKLGKGFAEFGIDFSKGFANVAKGTAINVKSKLDNILRYGAEVLLLKDSVNKALAKKKKGNLTKKDVSIVKKQLEDVRKANTLRKILSKDPKTIELLEKEESKLSALVIGLGVAGTAAAAIGGVTALVSSITLGAVGAIVFARQALSTVREPTPQNFGRLAFFSIPTALAILKTTRKLSPNFRPNVKNVSILKKQLSDKLISNDALLKQAIKIKNNRAKRQIIAQNKAIRQGIKEMNWLLKNKQILISRDYNPIVHTKNYRKLAGSYKEGVHVSTEKNINKLFGQKVERLITQKQAKELLKKVKIEEPKKINIQTRGKIENSILAYSIKRKLILFGGRALQARVSTLKRILTGRSKSKDFDLFSRTSKKDAMLMTAFLNKKFNTNAFTFRKGVSKGTYKIYRGNEHFVDITIPRGKVRFITLKNGLRVQTQKQVLKGKLEAAIDRSGKKQSKDIKDVLLASKGQIKAKDILGKRKNPSNTFEVVNQVQGMGKSRLAFDETHMYFDFEAAVAYSQGKPYSIIKFPVAKITKFPNNLTRLIKKAGRGELSTSQGTRLRVALNNYIKNNPNKFFLSPRTASLPIGEREIVLADASKFIKGNLYKTFDNDLQTFISVIEVAFRKPQKISLFRRFINSWKNKPFRTLKLRLSNPDILNIRRYARIVERDIPLGRTRIENLLFMFKKMLTTKKAQARLKKPIKQIKKKKRVKPRKVKLRKRKVIKRITKRTIPRVKKRVVERARPKQRPRKKARPVTRPRTPVRSRPQKRIPIRARTPVRTRKRSDVRPRVQARPVTRITPRKKKKIIKFRKTIIRKIKDTLKNPTQKKINEINANVKQMFIFTPDLYSRLFGVRTNLKNARLLLRKGRIFTGAELRPIIPAKLQRRILAAQK